MRLQDILAATSAQGAENYPYYLSLLAIVISLIAIFRASAPTAGKSQAAAPPTSPSAAKNSQAAPASQAVPPEIVAVIAAAVATVTGSSHRIVSIKPMSTSWERAGRQSVLTSHRIR